MEDSGFGHQCPKSSPVAVPTCLIGLAPASTAVSDLPSLQSGILHAKKVAGSFFAGHLALAADRVRARADDDEVRLDLGRRHLLRRLGSGRRRGNLRPLVQELELRRPVLLVGVVTPAVPEPECRPEALVVGVVDGIRPQYRAGLRSETTSIWSSYSSSSSSSSGRSRESLDLFWSSGLFRLKSDALVVGCLGISHSQEQLKRKQKQKQKSKLLPRCADRVVLTML